MPEDLSSALVSVVGPSNVLVDPQVKAAYEQDWTRRFGGPSQLVVRPGSAAEVSAVVVECAARGVPIVIQGGNTGLVGGGVPDSKEDVAPVVVSTARLKRIEEVDPVAAQVTADAGATLAELHRAARRAHLAFAVDFAARDSATVGGMIATNAGGVHVLRYGSMRSQVLGVEAVLADGAVISHLSGLVKDNTGYDLSQLLSGSEGTLGIITRARVRLVAEPSERVVALAGLPDTVEALTLLDRARRQVEGLQAAELFYRDGLELVLRHTGAGDPLPRPWPAYLLLEAAAMADPTPALFEALSELGEAEDATAVATDPAGRDRLWAYRERHTEAVSALGVPHKLDVSLPQGGLAAFEEALRPVVAQAAPGSTLVLFGHAGDGNLHVNIVGPEADDEQVDEAVLRLVASMGGSISAEHGIGRAKSRWLHLAHDDAEIAAMRAIKSALDPKKILNPGVIFRG